MADWGFVFVDDFCWLLRKKLAEPLTCSILLFLVAFGCPLSWKKAVIGASNTWLGFIVTPRQQLVLMVPTKHELVMAVVNKMMTNEFFTRTELDSALGRLQWATNCCPLNKPFLQAFWQWKTAVRNSGWICNHPNPEKHQVWWFHYQVQESDHPWAFKDKKPKRRIAALEMFGTLILTLFLCRRSAPHRGLVQLPLASDNRGNIYGLLNAWVRKEEAHGRFFDGGHVSAYSEHLYPPAHACEAWLRPMGWWPHPSVF